jgi:hypothetical protein
VEQPLVHQREEGVEDGRIPLEGFVKHGNLGLRQLVGRDAGVPIVLESFEAHWTEDFLRDGELREETLEVSSAECLCDSACERALAGARWAKQEDVIAGKQCEQSSLDELAALGELDGEVLSEVLKLLKGAWSSRLPWDWAASAPLVRAGGAHGAEGESTRAVDGGAG